MSQYFVLNCTGAIGSLFFQLEADSEYSGKRWKAGQMFSPQEKHNNLQPPADIGELTTRVDSKVRERTYSELMWHPIPLMTRRLVAALSAAGVSNLQTYETRLINPQPQGANIPSADHYLAVNIIGLVAAADLSKSELNPEVTERLISMDFHSLAVDKLKARNQLMFRLAENISAVLVHECVRIHVESRGINTLAWYKPEEWAG